MSNVDKTLVGSNFCGLECSNKNNPIHPQTCTSQVLKTHNSNFTLVDWINYKTSEESVDKTFQKSASLLDWLTTNYPIESKSIPIADNNTIGGIKLGEHNEFLQITDGVLTFKDSSLPSVEKASFETLGAIKLGNDSIMEDVEFNSSLYPITEDDYHCFPLVRDNSNDHRAGIAIPKELFNSTQVQVNWNESDPTSLAYILNKPTNLTIQPATIDVLGGIKLGYSITRINCENDKAVDTDSNNKAYIKLHTPKYTIINSGLSQHYFEITNDSTDDIYVPLFKIEGESKHAVLVSNIRFEIIGINNYSYYGEFMVNYHDCHDLLKIHLVGNDRLSQSDIVAVATPSVNPQKIIVYRKISHSSPVITDVFMVNILSSNVFDSNPVSITYYTNANSTDVDYDVNETSLNNWRDSDSMIVTTIPSDIHLTNQPSN